MEVRNLTKVPYFYNINFYIREGEIVGLSGLEGCGRYEVGRALAGLITPNTGEILYNGKKIRIMNSSFALKNGICLLPRDRKGEGLFSLLNILYNLSFVKLQEDIVLNGKKYEKVALNYIDKLRIKCSSLRQNINELSGGNQQKCVVSRCLSINPIIYILEEPTRGIDIKTKVEIFEIMDNVVKKGSGILLISSELQELINICDRILVMYSGRIVADLKREEFSSEKIMMYATGAVGSKC
ncbi:MAG: sugar ABC transporter ATP-binding protein [Actinobacteria bacterium]|nr:sugar ABC transporter ATP-binding protein [Actinomycetota bacterium]